MARITLTGIVLWCFFLCLGGSVRAGEIHLAAQKGDLKSVERFLKENPELLNIGDISEGRTPLHWACQGGSVEVATFLIKKAAKVHAKDMDGQEPLHCATREEIARILINRGANGTEKDNYGRIPLHYAAYYGRDNMVKYFLYIGSPVNAIDDEGNTPLVLAVEQGKKGAVEELIAKGAQVNVALKDGSTPLSIAKKKGYREIILILEKNNARD